MKKLFFKNFSIILVIAIVFSFFLPSILTGKVPIPADSILGLYHPWRDISTDDYAAGKFPVKNPLITDSVLQTFPWRNLVIKNFKFGDLPLWNPYSFSGQPLLANFQSSPFQVINVLFFLLPFKLAWHIGIVIPPVLAGLFMYFFLRSLNLSKNASLFGSIVLPFSGFFVSWMEWGTIITSAMWLPLILLCIKKIFEKISSIWILLLIFSISQSIFSGHLQTSFYSIVATLLFLVFQLYLSRNFKSSLIIFFALISSLLICSVQILPGLEFIKLSAREVDQTYYKDRQDWFLPPRQLVQTVAPDFFGNPTTYNYWGVWNYGEFVSFIGIVPAVMAIIALTAKKKKAAFFIFLAFFSLLFALPNPISKIPYTLKIPFISNMQPSRIIFLFVFSVSVLCAFGFESFNSEKRKRLFISSFMLIGIFLIGLFFFALFFKQRFPHFETISPLNIALRNLIIPTGVLVLVVSIFLLKLSKISQKLIILFLFIVTITELFRFAYKFTPFSKYSWIFPSTRALDFLQNQKRPFRVMMTDRRIMHPNTQANYQIESVSGYDPLYLSSYSKLVSSWNADRPQNGASFNRIINPQNYDSPMTNLLDVKYILTFDYISNPNFHKVMEENETKIYENKNFLPRAYFVENVIKVNDEDQELKMLLDKGFDIRTSSVSSDIQFKEGDKLGSVDFQTYKDQTFTLTTNTRKESPLIISNTNYPGWEAEIDGKKTEIKKVNFIQQAVIVPEGDHTINFKYKPKSFYNGMYLTLAGVLFSTILTIFTWRKKYQS